MKYYQIRCEDLMKDFIEKKAPSFPSRLSEAMAYALFAGGKRLRPLLVYGAGTLYQVPHELLDPLAMAVEFIHTYSLIHDDLPAMDDDDLRRGRPACHIAYDEATAILAGDALQCLAFEALSESQSVLPPKIQLEIIHRLAVSIGQRGMALGQMLDLIASDAFMEVEALNRIHELKTGALIQTSLIMGAKANPSVFSEDISYLEEVGYWLGLGFQIRDDLLDVTGTTEQLGKPQGSDHLNEKITYPVLMGMEAAEAQAHFCFQQAENALKKINGNTHMLHSLGEYLIIRDK